MAQDDQVGAARDAAPRAPIGRILVGAVLVAAGALLLREAIGEVDEDKAFVGGPRLAPIVVSGGWLIIAVLYLAQQIVAWRITPASEPAEATAPSARRTPLFLILALIAYVQLLEPVGFVLTTAVFFVTSARILHSTRALRDVVVAVPLTLGVYLFFTRFLEIHLPEGVLPL